MAKAIQDISQYYSIEISPKAVAHLKLVIVAASVYGPKLLIIRAQSKAKTTAAIKKPVQEPIFSEAVSPAMSQPGTIRYDA